MPLFKISGADYLVLKLTCIVPRQKSCLMFKNNKYDFQDATTNVYCSPDFYKYLLSSGTLGLG